MLCMGSVYISTVRMLEKHKNKDRDLKALLAALISASAYPSNTVSSIIRLFTN